MEIQWKEVAHSYSILYEKFTLIFGLTLINMLKIETVSSILDCACGSGLLSTEILRRKNNQSELYVSDITPEMLIRAKFRV